MQYISNYIQIVDKYAFNEKYDLRLTSIHLMWESRELQEMAIVFTPNFVNSGISLTTLANSVVQTGVKSFG